MKTKLIVQRSVCARIPTQEGEFKLCLYENNQDDKEHLALIIGEVAGQSDVLVRMHSECFTGDVLGSRRCDCGEQLHSAMHTIAQAGQGVIIYLRQEGRGIGLRDKLRAYNLQDEGFDTVDANLLLGHQADERDYTVAARILEDLGLTNNPAKIDHLKRLGVKISERIQMNPTVYADNASYLQTKVLRMNHLLNLNPLALNAVQSQNASI